MSSDPAPLSKTAKYKKITKPLLERKRRARINRCLDELKDLMVGALEIDDDNLSKLEKADILELTVNHLTKLHSPKDPVMEAKKFQAGFGQCAAEACRFIMSMPDLDSKVSQNLVSHLSRLITEQPLTIHVPERPPFSPPTSPLSLSDRHHYYSDHDISSDAEDSLYSGDGASKWAYSRSNPVLTRSYPPAGGLLTTVDKLGSHNAVLEHRNGPVNGQRNGTYFNRAPAESKDVILQKIRQHIMDKRGSENCHVDVNVSSVYDNANDRSEDYLQYLTANSSGNETLDLRKVRSPTKTSIESAHSPNISATYHETNQSAAITSAENKVDVTANVPERCELPMDYSNLPPKKKRKLIEYQEYKKQEEAKRQLEALNSEKKGRLDDGPPTGEDASKWRPW